MELSKFKFKNILKYIKMFVKHPKPFRYMYGTFLSYSGLCKFIILKRDGFNMRFNSSAISLGYFVNKNSRKEDDMVLEQILKNGDVYIDVGANIGTLCLRSSTIVGKSGKVIGIEAHPKTFSHLVENYSLNAFDNEVLINCGVGEKEGELWFSDKNADDQNHVMKEKSGVKIEVKPLDDLVSDEKKVKLLKIDVEGYELFVLKGGLKTLNVSDYILIEISEQHFNKFGYSLKDVLSLLVNQGFQIFKYSVTDILEFEMIDEYYTTDKLENLLCVKSGLPDSIVK